MALRLTKHELRDQQQRLAQLRRYLPTLQLKKSLLQVEVNTARVQVQELERKLSAQKVLADESAALLTERGGVEAGRAAAIVQVERRWDNIAGVNIPYFVRVQFEPYEPSLFVLPPWGDPVIGGLRLLMELKAQLEVARERYSALASELRTVSLRVNLFEKVLIPRTQANMRKIQVFLGDQQLASVAQAKAAKAKILRHRAHFEGEADAD
jgi:V/A-type H+/Na+-transporting ATPase subunit D